MGDYNDAFMRNQNAAVQARTKAQNRANVLQLKLVGGLLLIIVIFSVEAFNCFCLVLLNLARVSRGRSHSLIRRDADFFFLVSPSFGSCGFLMFYFRFLLRNDKFGYLR